VPSSRHEPKRVTRKIAGAYKELVGYDMGFRLVAISSDTRLMASGAESTVDSYRTG
jgi:hypothetical protein